jgi:hypothetical protein
MPRSEEEWAVLLAFVLGGCFALLAVGTVTGGPHALGIGGVMLPASLAVIVLGGGALQWRLIALRRRAEAATLQPLDLGEHFSPPEVRRLDAYLATRPRLAFVVRWAPVLLGLAAIALGVVLHGFLWLTGFTTVTLAAVALYAGLSIWQGQATRLTQAGPLELPEREQALSAAEIEQLGRRAGMGGPIRQHPPQPWRALLWCVLCLLLAYLSRRPTIIADRVQVSAAFVPLFVGMEFALVAYGQFVQRHAGAWPWLKRGETWWRWAIILLFVALSVTIGRQWFWQTWLDVRGVLANPMPFFRPRALLLGAIIVSLVLSLVPAGSWGRRWPHADAFRRVLGWTSLLGYTVFRPVSSGSVTITLAICVAPSVYFYLSGRQAERDQALAARVRREPPLVLP